MKTCFGSIGAARIMDTADRWESGMASWDISPTPGALTLWRDMRWVSNDIGHRWAWHIGGEEIDRDTARVILEICERLSRARGRSRNETFAGCDAQPRR